MVLGLLILALILIVVLFRLWRSTRKRELLKEEKLTVANILTGINGAQDIVSLEAAFRETSHTHSPYLKEITLAYREKKAALIGDKSPALVFAEKKVWIKRMWLISFVSYSIISLFFNFPTEETFSLKNRDETATSSKETSNSEGQFHKEFNLVLEESKTEDKILPLFYVTENQKALIGESNFAIWACIMIILFFASNWFIYHCAYRKNGTALLTFFIICSPFQIYASIAIYLELMRTNPSELFSNLFWVGVVNALDIFFLISCWLLLKVNKETKVRNFLS